MLKVNVENISLTDTGEKQPLLQNINFEIHEGKVYTILGKNGTGKSTLIKSLTGLLSDNLFSIKGTIFFNDQNLFTTEPESLRKIRSDKIRYVFQDAVNSYDPLKTFEYYFKFSNAERENIESLLDYFLLPGYNDISKLFPYEVSGGMAQRLSMVLAFAVNPKLIIFDEPTSGVDYAVANLLLLKLKDFTKKDNNIALMVTQDINFAEKVSDEIALLADGKLSSFSPVKEFFNRNDNETLNEFINSYNEIR